MVEVVQFPSVESLVRAYLAPKLPGSRVATRIPNPREARMVRLQAVGGSRRGLALSSRLLIVQCWDSSEPATAALAETVSAIVFAAEHDPDVPEIRRVRSVGEPSSFPDPGTSLPRYQFTVSLDIRGHVTTA